MENNKFLVYCHIFPNDKRYVGITGSKTVERWANGKGYKSQQRAIYSAINRYGWENVKHEIIANNLSQEEAESLEKKLIEEWHLQERKYGYNIRCGGGSKGKLSKESIDRISRNHADVSGCNNPMFGVHRYGEKNPNYGNRGAKNPLYGHKPSEETIKKLSEVKKKPVICLTTGEKFSSMSEASQKKNISISLISGCCNKRLNSAGGLVWEFIYKENVKWSK